MSELTFPPTMSTVQDLLVKKKYSLCRLCLCTGQLLDIFSKENEFVLKNTIEELMGCEVEREGGFPWLICHTCEAKLTDISLFKRRCLECKQAFDIRFQSVKCVTKALADDDDDESNPGDTSELDGVERNPLDGIDQCIGGGRASVGINSVTVNNGKVSNNVIDCRVGIIDGTSSVQDIKDEPIDEVSNDVVDCRVGIIDGTSSHQDIKDEPTDEADVGRLKVDQFECQDVGAEDSIPSQFIAGVGDGTSENGALDDMLGDIDVKEEPLYTSTNGRMDKQVSIQETRGQTGIANGDVVPSKPLLSITAMKYGLLPFPRVNRVKIGCCARRCPNAEWNESKHYRRVPKNPERGTEWLERAGRTDLLRLGPVLWNKKYRLCLDHFERELVLPSGKLVWTAIPTLFAHGQDPPSPEPPPSPAAPDSPATNVPTKVTGEESVTAAMDTTPIPVKKRVKAPRKQVFEKRCRVDLDCE